MSDETDRDVGFFEAWFKSLKPKPDMDPASQMFKYFLVALGAVGVIACFGAMILILDFVSNK